MCVCSDGVRQCGLYVAVSVSWERMRVEQEVDVYHTVKNLRFQRPDIVTELVLHSLIHQLPKKEIYVLFKHLLL